MMKKIFCFIMIILIITGCDKKVKTTVKEKRKEVAKTIISEKRRLFSYVVNNVSHDDYYQEEENKDNEQTIVVKNEEVESVINKTSSEDNSIEIIEEKNNTMEEAEELVIEDDKEETQIKDDEEDNIDNTDAVEEEKETTNIPPLEEKKEIVLNEEVISSKINSVATNVSENRKLKVIDVSYYQGDINWDLFVKKSDCYGVILRIGYWNTLDKKFESYIKDIKRLNIPYGIYLYSYSSSLYGSNIEANFTNYVIDKYSLNPILGIYYDIESWKTKTSSSDNITKNTYDEIISNYVNKVSNHINNKYKVKVYSGRWYAMNRLGDISKSYVDWVAEYNDTCKYDQSYSMWQYTSKGIVPGIKGNVDISYMY